MSQWRTTEVHFCRFEQINAAESAALLHSFFSVSLLLTSQTLAFLLKFSFSLKVTYYPFTQQNPYLYKTSLEALRRHQSLKWGFVCCLESSSWKFLSVSLSSVRLFTLPFQKHVHHLSVTILCYFILLLLYFNLYYILHLWLIQAVHRKQQLPYKRQCFTLKHLYSFLEN